MGNEAALTRYLGRQATVESPNFWALVRNNGTARHPEAIFMAVTGDTSLPTGACLFMRPDGTYGLCNPLDPGTMPATVIIEERAGSTVYIVRPLGIVQEMAMAGLAAGVWYYVGTDGKLARTSDATFPTAGLRQVIGQALPGLLRIQPGSGLSDPSGLAPLYSFWTPWTNTDDEQFDPSPNPSDHNDEFNDPSSLSSYHKMGVWTVDGLDRGGMTLTTPPDEVFYSFTTRPSWLMMQPRAGLSYCGLERSYGSLPENWVLTAHASIDLNGAVGADAIFFLIMGQEDEGDVPDPTVNPFYPMDIENYLTIYVAAVNGIPLISFAKRVDGDFTVIGQVAIDARMHGYNLFRIHKVGGSYIGSIGTLGGNWFLMGSTDFEELNASRYGFLIEAPSPPNVTFGLDWIRHRELAAVAD